MDINILYQDNDIIVCIKPRGVLSQADESGNENMCTIIEEHLKAQKKPVYVGVIHRLDVGVSGVMVYAISKKAAAKLSAVISDKQKCQKTYLAAVHGEFEEKSGIMRDLLFKDTHLGKSYVVSTQRKGVKEAILDYEVLEQNCGFSLVKATLHTGRTHQIRVQFASRGHSLTGDKKYGARDQFRSIGLFSHSLSFPHPITDKTMSFFALPDKDDEPWCSFTYFDNKKTEA